MIACYIRVSTYEQNLEAQRLEISKWLSNHGLQDVRWYEDKQTGKNLQRPGFERLQKDIFSGEVDTVIVWKLDRLARSFRDGVKVITDWIQQDIRLVSVTQQIDLSGVVGQMIAGVLFAVAEMELVAIKERQAAGIAVAKARGVYKGRKPGARSGNPQEARRLQERGFSAPEIAKQLDISERSVYRYLKAE